MGLLESNGIGGLSEDWARITCNEVITAPNTMNRNQREAAEEP